jgi:hypothetical protein
MVAAVTPCSGKAKANRHASAKRRTRLMRKV